MKFDRSNPYLSKITGRMRLTKEGSTKQTYHISLDVKGSELQYKVGDSIAIFAQNDPTLVEHLLKAMKATGDEEIVEQRSGIKMPIRTFLASKANLSRVTSSFLKLFYEYEPLHDKKNHLDRILKEDRTQLSQYLAAHDPLDLLKEYSEAKAPLQELCNQFAPLLPRFYSVASSPLANPDELHLTVALFTFNHAGEQRFGVASHFLCHLAKQDTPIPIYVQPANSFTLPEDANAPIIMIGPGTGVAPFRAFMQERTHLNSRGKNWLFFGERNRASDYFYEDFWEDLVKKEQLILDLAFSRDQSEKVYVQHKLYDKAQELWSWLQSGAYLYVCGDASKMAKDVESALHRIAQEQAGFSPEEAKAYFKAMRAQKRYLLDVY